MDEGKLQVEKLILVEKKIIHSQYLERAVTIDAYLPTEISILDSVSLLLINDGQDLVKMPFENILHDLIRTNQIQKMICIGIYCGAERIREYGTAFSVDYIGRGDRAGLYNKFIFDELLPFIRKTFGVQNFKDKSFAGFSLGGLSALDVVWNHANEFSKVGMFSPSLWWRRKAYNEGYNDETDRLMHLQIRSGFFHPWLQFFIQCGTLDESADRNKNGIIDSIDDALDLIVELKAKGYTDNHIIYLLLEGGKHDITTWANALPQFLQWGWGKV
jgi:enterochelin esterase-like enzyme